MLVRDAPDLQVFMLRRNLQSRWIGGAYIFPGGAVDAADREPAVLPRCVGRDDRSASALLGVGEGGLGFWVAAIRETFEEAGVLLTRSEGTGERVDPSAPGVGDRLAVARPEVAAGERSFLELLEQEQLLLDVGALHRFSHWITPAGAPRRYDTWFFVAEAPDGHAYRHDDGETVDSMWIKPTDALEQAERGELLLIFPTVRNLVALSRFETAAELLGTVGVDPPPRLVPDFGGSRIELPHDRDAGDPQFGDEHSIGTGRAV